LIATTGSFLITLFQFASAIGRSKTSILTYPPSGSMASRLAVGELPSGLPSFSITRRD
jgi:hypothetical protein